ncbi:MAG TPA: hypothetical protein VG370_31170, partial [Chloroflexota bacterium]|nr:hypothetical protein [Chloroflexota bacterium]
ELYPAELLRKMRDERAARDDRPRLSELERLIRLLVPDKPNNWWEQPGAPRIEPTQVLTESRNGGPWKLEQGLKQVSGTDIGNLRYAYRHGEDETPFAKLDFKGDREWRCAPFSRPPLGLPFAVILTFWWDGAERTLTYLWPAEERIQKIDLGKITDHG